MNDRRIELRASFLTLLALPVLLLLLSGSGGCAGPGQQPLEIQFVAEVGDSPARCGARYEGVGVLGAAAELADARLYVSNFELHLPDGTTLPFELEQESPWQHGSVALLDFEDGTGRCSDSGTAQMNGSVVGFATPGEYSGLSFEVGVPTELNHLDSLTAPSPLNLNALYWNWRLGYIFTKIELWNDGVTSVAPSAADEPAPGTAPATAPAIGVEGPTVTYLAHVGSTGCESPAPTMAPTEPCSRPNRARIFLEGFDPRTHEVGLDLAGLVDSIDITRSVLRPPGCMSAPTDPDCRQVFANLGLDLATGRCFTDCSDQKLAEGRRIGDGG